MPRKPKPSVRFALIKKKRFPFQTVRLCATYDGKRLYYTAAYADNQWYGIDFSQFNTDGTLRPNFTIPDTPKGQSEKEYLDDSEYLVRLAHAAKSVIDEANKRGVWERMTSADFARLLDMVDLRDRELEWAKNGQVAPGNTTENYNRWGSYPTRLYEWHWQQVGKGRL